ncbi:MAG: hypothetical protein J2P50_16635 [Hyphomicrobiaceae bacterium]|nr:hypothetical protein [Hyphomicrobiaceae bacterium]
MRSILWAVAATALVLGASTSTSAQGTGAKKQTGKALYSGSAKAGQRGKRYYYRSGSKTCGQFHYLKNGKCVDARTTPPKLK